MSANLFIKALAPERVVLLGRITKQDALDKLITILADSDMVRSRADLEKAILERESLMSTGIGLGIAVPHVRLLSVSNIVMAAAMCSEGISDYDSLDGQPVRIIFMIAARLDQHSEYLQTLSSLSSAIKKPDLRATLLAAKDAKAFFKALQAEG